MFHRNTAFAALLAVFGVTAVFASGYDSNGVLNARMASDTIALKELGEAQASAISNAAGAKASAAKIDSIRYKELDKYGTKIGRPLLTRNYGDMTNLYAAMLPPRSFVGQTDPAFVKDSYGRVRFIGEHRIGVVAI